MKWLNQLEKKFGFLAIPNLTFILIVGQIAVLILSLINPTFLPLISLQGSKILGGEVWRIITFLFVPIFNDPLFALLSWLMYHSFGTALEHVWGSFRYTLYIFISALATVILSLIFPVHIFTNTFIYASVFLGYSYLFPNTQLSLFFIIPVKIKWLAALMWVGILVTIITGEMSEKLIAIVSNTNFLLYFGENIWIRFVLKQHHAGSVIRSAVEKKKAYHVCAICKKNEIDNPSMQILYCSDCEPSTCYCEDHIDTHSHLSKRTIN